MDEESVIYDIRDADDLNQFEKEQLDETSQADLALPMVKVNPEVCKECHYYKLQPKVVKDLISQ